MVIAERLDARLIDMASVAKKGMNQASANQIYGCLDRDWAKRDWSLRDQARAAPTPRTERGPGTCFTDPDTDEGSPTLKGVYALTTRSKLIVPPADVRGVSKTNDKMLASISGSAARSSSIRKDPDMMS